MVPTLIHSFMISQIFGLYMIILAIVMFSRVGHFRSMFAKIQSDDIALYISASFGLLLGIFLVDMHNMWVFKPRVLVTLLCWAILLKSIFWLAFPERMTRMTKAMIAGKGYYFSILILAVWGIFLLARGSLLDFYSQVLQVLS